MATGRPVGSGPRAGKGQKWRGERSGRMTPGGGENNRNRQKQMGERGRNDSQKSFPGREKVRRSTVHYHAQASSVVGRTLSSSGT